MLRSFFAPRIDGSLKEAIEEAIEEVLEENEARADEMAPEEKTMLRNVLTFGDITVHDIMTPRPDIMAVEIETTLEELKHHMLEQRHTRVPVYRENLDHIEGFLHIKDLVPVLAGDMGFDLKSLLRPMLFAPPSMRVIDLLVKMRRTGSHMAIVVDEHGGTDGLVTLEDVFEEIVGEIQDEHDDEETNRDLVKLSDNAFEADARLRIEKLEEALGFELLNEQEGEEFDTVGGLIFFELGRVPVKGEVLTHPTGVRFEILDADPRRIRRVKVSQVPASAHAS